MTRCRRTPTRVTRVVGVLALALAGWAGSTVPAAAGSPHIETRLTASDGAAADFFGAAVALDGGTAVIGAPGDDDLAPDAGAAYVFLRDPLDPTAWSEAARLTASDGAVQHEFGSAVGFDGGTALVGAPWDYLPQVAGDVWPGAAYVFEHDPVDPTVWVETARLAGDDPIAIDRFGHAVDIDGDIAVVGAPLDEDLGYLSGSAYVFERDPADPSTWVQAAKLTAADGTDGDYFGWSVGVSGTTVVVGAKYHGDEVYRAGAVYVFERDLPEAGAWGQSAKLTASEREESDQLGRSVAISGDTVLAGAWELEALGAGEAYVFERDPDEPGGWTETAVLTADDAEVDDLFGATVALDGERAVVGSLQDNEVGFDAGAAYVFERAPADPASWVQTARLTASDGGDGHLFGVALAVSGEQLLVGATGADGGEPLSGVTYAEWPEDALHLGFAGACPGAATLRVSGASPAGEVAMVAGAAPGAFVLQGGPCAGTELGVAPPKLLGLPVADGDGVVSLEVELPEAACGRHLQALDLDTCRTSGLAPLP